VDKWPTPYNSHLTGTRNPNLERTRILPPLEMGGPAGHLIFVSTEL
jgi:hypothetical protein